MINKMIDIGRLINTQDNRCTSEPMFCVQGRRRIYGFDTQWTDDIAWIDTSDGAYEVEKPDDEQETDTIIKTGYIDVWETLMVAFTEEACKEHLELNGHNYGGYKEVRIYVESFRRCPEMIAIRKFLSDSAVEASNDDYTTNPHETR
jgi:hypothetical protein